MSGNRIAGVLSVAGTLAVVIVGGGVMYGCPQYSVYTQRTAGEAELAQAEYSKKVQVQDAEGKLAAASKLAEAEVARARGAAEANKIIGDSLKDNSAYLQYLWITDMTAGGKSPAIIYVPSQGGIPLLEAGRAPLTGPFHALVIVLTAYAIATAVI
jgi:hypothetical protein